MNTRLLRLSERVAPGSCVIRADGLTIDVYSADGCRPFFPNPLYRPFDGLVQVWSVSNSWAGFARDRKPGWCRRSDFRAELARAARGECSPARNAPENWRDYLPGAAERTDAHAREIAA